MKSFFSALVASAVLLQAYALPSAVSIRDVEVSTVASLLSTNTHSSSQARTDGGYYPDECCYATVPLHRAYSPSATDHFYTASETEANYVIINGGYGTEGTAGYVYATQVGASIPLYRLYNPVILDNFFTTDEVERENAIRTLGYADLGVTCYVLPSL